MPQVRWIWLSPATGCQRAISSGRHLVGNRHQGAEPRLLATFYLKLLGWPIGHEEPGTAIRFP